MLSKLGNKSERHNIMQGRKRNLWTGSNMTSKASADEANAFL
jgi:hypothetical protein